MSELLKCPFCGGEAIIKSICNTHEPDTDDWWVSCRICRVERPSTQKGEIAHTKADAIAAWNRRAQPTMPSDVREALRRLVDNTITWDWEVQAAHQAIVRAWLDAHAQEPTLLPQPPTVTYDMNAMDVPSLSDEMRAKLNVVTINAAFEPPQPTTPQT